MPADAAYQPLKQSVVLLTLFEQLLFRYESKVQSSRLDVNFGRRTQRFFLLSVMTSPPPGWLLWQTFPTYVTSTCFPFSFRITNRTFTLHSGRLHSAPPLKNTAEWILREFSDLTWLFLKRKLHHGLLSLTLLRKIRVQSPLNNRPPLGNVLIGILFQSSLDSLNLAVVPSIFLRKYFSCLPSSSPSSDESESSYENEKPRLLLFWLHYLPWLYLFSA